MALVEFDSVKKNEIISQIDVLIKQLREICNHPVFQDYKISQNYYAKYIDQYFIGIINKYESKLRQNISLLEKLKRCIDRSSVVYANAIDDFADYFNMLRVTEIKKRENKIL